LLLQVAFASHIDEGNGDTGVSGFVPYKALDYDNAKFLAFCEVDTKNFGEQDHEGLSYASGDDDTSALLSPVANKNPLEEGVGCDVPDSSSLAGRQCWRHLQGQHAQCIQGTTD
jgi:hypothetical protein